MLPSTVDTMATESDSMGDNLKEIKRKIALAKCGVCGSREAKYRCPGCFKHSCSLSCVQNHKVHSGCSGVRDKTAFVALSQFDEMNLLSDYRFLEDTGRLADGATRDPIAHTNLNYKAKRLTASARKLNITLRFLPINFTQSRENSTIRLLKGNCFFWHLKLLFPQSSTEFTERRVADVLTLEQILTPYIHPTESDPVKRQKLKMYVNTFDHVKVFMKVEGRKANSVRYDELDLAKSLRDNLSYKTVIEYPVLHVVLKGHCHDYPLKEPECVRAIDRPTFQNASLDWDQRRGLMEMPLTQSGTDVLKETQSCSPEPPKRKRAKSEHEELEDGEIRDSSDEEVNMEEKVLVKGGSNDNVGHEDASVAQNPTSVCGRTTKENEEENDRLPIDQTVAEPKELIDDPCLRSQSDQAAVGALLLEMINKACVVESAENEFVSQW